MATPPTPPRPDDVAATRGAVRRHPLGLPAGSVRALLTLAILGLVWTLMLLPEDRALPGIPIYLYYLMFVALVHFFAAHGNTIASGDSPEPSPWYLPRGVLRMLIILGFAGVIGWRIYTGRDVQELKPLAQANDFVYLYLPLIIVVAFLLGVTLTRVLHTAVGGPRGLPYWYQDVQAWVAILAMLGLGAEVIIQAVINPTLPEDRHIQLPEWQAFLAAVICFYFGARS